MSETTGIEEDEARLAELMERYDPREVLKDTPARDMLPSSEWDEVVETDRRRD